MTIPLGNAPIATPSGTFKTPSQGLSGLLIGNESGYTLIISLDGTGYGKTLYPSTVDYFPVSHGYTGSIKYATLSILNNISSWPSSSILVDGVGIGEILNITSYPLTLPRQVNSNTTMTTTTANTIADDGRASGASPPTVEASITGIAGSTISISNDGTWILKGNRAGTLIQWLLSIPGAANGASVLQLGDVNRLVEILGTLLVDKGKIGVAADGDLIDASGVGTTLKGHSAGNVIFQVNGVNIAFAQSGGLSLATGTFGFISGTISRYNGTVTSCGSGTVISHGLGSSPTSVNGTPQVTQPGSATVGISNYTSTTFTATIGAGTALAWMGFVA